MDDQNYLSTFNLIEKQYLELRDNPNASTADLRHLLLDIEEVIGSPEYQSLTLEQRNTLQSTRKELMRRIQGQENGNNSVVEKNNGPNQQSTGKTEINNVSAPAPE